MAPSNIRLNSVVAIEVPDGVNCDGARNYMSSRFKVEISGSLGLNIVRIGPMGEQCMAPNLFRVLHALGLPLPKKGACVDVSAGTVALDGYMSRYVYDIL